MKKISVFVVVLFTVFFTSLSCKKSSNSSSSGYSTMSMRLTDDPSSYDAVYIDIQQVGITMAGRGELMLTPIRPGVYDLLKFRNGLDTLLLRITIPPGSIEQMRLILGSNNSVVVGGVSYPLSTPSAQESGIKLNLNETFVANGSYDVWIDFDAGKSILQTGNGSFKLKPVVRAFSALTNGKIEGYVLPLTSLTTVYAINGVDTFSAIPSSFDGFFVIEGLPSGNYTVAFDAATTTGFNDLTMSNVTVTYGMETNLGTVVLTHP